jgi:hypothetical protein
VGRGHCGTAILAS